MLRIAGTCAVSAAIFLYGFFVSLSVSRKMVHEDAFISLLEYTGSMIRGGNMPLDRIISDFSDAALEKTGFLSSLRKYGCMKFGSVMKEYENRIFLDEKERSLLTEFFRETGGCPSGSQGAEICERYTVLFKDHVGSVRESEKKRAALSKKLGAVAAAAAFVVFI